jgi:hypothetical protein
MQAVTSGGNGVKAAAAAVSPGDPGPAAAAVTATRPAAPARVTAEAILAARLAILSLAKTRSRQLNA